MGRRRATALMGRRRVGVGVVCAVAAVVLFTACSSGSTAAPPTGAAGSGLGSSPGQPSGLAGGDGESAPASTAATTSSIPRPTALPPSPARTTTAPVREIAGSCPYISGADVAQIEGDRFGHSTIITSTPVGCRFYWAYDAEAIIAEITVRTYPTAVAAYNAMVISVKGHSEVVSDADIGAGAVAVRAPLQGVSTWECTFAKGRHVVTVHTRQPDPSFNARALARQIATRF